MQRLIQFNSTATTTTAVISKSYLLQQVVLSTSLRSAGTIGMGPSDPSGGGGNPPPKTNPITGMGAVPPYKKPPLAPVGSYLPVHHGGGTDPRTDPFIKKQSNQPTRAPETTVLQTSSSSGIIFSEEERQNPRLLADRRMPIGEWLRLQFADFSVTPQSQKPFSFDNSSSGSNSNNTSTTTKSHQQAQRGTPLEWYLASLQLSYKPHGALQQQKISTFEEDIIAEASVQNSRETSIEKTRWHGIVRKFTEQLFIFNPDLFLDHLSSLRPQVMDFFGDASYHSELEEVFEILCDDAKAWRNHSLRELSKLVSVKNVSTALEEGGLVWGRFFDVVERNKKEWIIDNPTRSAVWESSRDSAAASPVVVGPAICLLFIVVTSMDTKQAQAKLPPVLEHAKKSLLQQQQSSQNNNSSENIRITVHDLAENSNLWSNNNSGRGGDVNSSSIVGRFLSRDQLFDFCLSTIDHFLSPMNRNVIESLRRFGFNDISTKIEEVTTTSGGAVRESIVAEIVPAFKNMSEVRTVVERALRAGSSVASSASSSSGSSSTTSSDSSSSSGAGRVTQIRSFVNNLLQTLVAETAAPEKQQQQQQNKSTSTSMKKQTTTSQQSSSSLIDLQPLFKELQPHWEKIYQRFATTLLGNAQVASIVQATLYQTTLSSGTRHTRAVASPFESQKVKEIFKKLAEHDAESKRLCETTAKNARLQLLSQCQSDSNGGGKIVIACSKMLVESISEEIRGFQKEYGNLQNSLRAATSSSASSEISTTANLAQIKNSIRETQKTIIQLQQKAHPLENVLNNNIQRATKMTTATSTSNTDSSENSSENNNNIVPDWAYRTILQKLIQDYPNWKSSNIIPDSLVVVSPDPLKAHELLLRIYLRLTYVPHAANALFKSRHRRRIGPIAKTKQQFNVEAEVGFAEEYNNQEYKQWDWQGWYQRMLDVFHRNVSLRVRLEDLKKLDNNGKPFLDFQTERRMRVVAGERVGAGMVKLDNDRFEDQSDNLDYGTGKLQQLISESKKAQLGKEYWPTVEVKVREPSGQTKMRYSLLDWDRVEKQSQQMFEKYRTAKSRAVYVPPTETWLNVGGGTGVAKTATASVDSEGYTVDTMLSGGESKNK